MFSPITSALEGTSVDKPAVTSSADGEITVAVVEGSSAVRVVEEVSAAVATTTIAVVEARTEAAEVTAEASDRDGGSSDHRAGKEVVEDALPNSRQETAAIEPEEEENFNFCSDFFSHVPPVGSSAIRSRDRVPHPMDFPISGSIFDNERLEKVWWDCIDQMEGLENPSRVVSSFALRSMNVDRKSVV